jgi:hypothetical protein
MQLIDGRVFIQEYGIPRMYFNNGNYTANYQLDYLQSEVCRCNDVNLSASQGNGIKLQKDVQQDTNNPSKTLHGLGKQQIR